MNVAPPLHVAGVDEAGRGPLAGPVSVAAVILDPSRPIAGLDDSKKLSEKKREALYPLIIERALAWHIEFVDAAEIDELNILQATLTGMRRAVEDSLGAVARPARVYIVNALPKTRSGKLLRRSLQALAQGADPGDLSTLDDPGALEEVKKALLRGPEVGG